MKNRLFSRSGVAALTEVFGFTSALRGVAAGTIWRRLAVSFVSTMLLTALGPSTASGQTGFAELTKVNFKNGRSNEAIGLAIAIDGNTMIVGAEGYGASVAINGAGAALVYVRNPNGAWVFQQRLMADAPTSSHGFGRCVGISGDTAIVGTYAEQAAYIFVRSASTWTRQARITVAGGSGFGQGCAISGDTVVVTDATGTSNASGNGRAHIFVRSGANWTQQGTLLPISGSVSGTIGYGGVAIEGDTVALGVITDDSYRGSVQVFVRNGTNWSPQQRILATDGGSNYQLGTSVAISGDTIVAGSPTQDGSGFKTGAAYVFVRSGSTWTQQQKLVTSDARSNASVGGSVTIEGNTAVLSSTGDNSVAGNGSGSAYVYQRNGTTWTETQKIFPSDLHRGSAFGYSLDMSQSNVAIGSPSDDIGTIQSQGAAYIFTSVPTSCTYSLNPTRRALFPPSGGTGSFTVTTQTGCAWQATVQDDVAWVTSTDAATGSGTVNFAVAANTGKPRRAEIAINGQTLHIVSQASGVSASPGDSDAAFGHAGSMTARVMNNNQTYGLAIGPDGKIVVAGSSFSPGASTVSQVLRFNPDGTLDATFDGDGVATIGTTKSAKGFCDVAIQSDGKIVAVGRGGVGFNDEFHLARFNTDGSIDSTFGSGGVVVTDFGATTEYASTVAMAPDGKIVVAGPVQGDVLGIARYNSNGSLDTTFDGDGKVSVPSTLFGFADLKVQTDGRIVVLSRNMSAQTIVLRYNTNGSPDTTFDGDGRAVVTAVNCASTGAIALDSSGRILVGGCRPDFINRPDFALTRLNTDGSVDAGFGSSGVTQANFSFEPSTVDSHTYDTLTDIAVLPDGRIVAAGYAQMLNQYSGTPSQIAVARFTASGALDTTFGTGGTVNTHREYSIHDRELLPNAIGLQADGKIVVAGSYTFRTGYTDVMVHRLLGDIVTGPPALAPALAFNVTSSGAELSGYVISDGGAVVTDRGVVYSPAQANADPTIGGPSVARVTVSGTTGLFSAGVTALQTGTTYAFKSYAVNAQGTGYSPAATFTTTASVPGAPTITSVSPGNGSVTVSFAAPSSNGGAAITGYTATCGAQSAAGSGSPITVSGLTNGVAVTCTVVATNSIGNSPSSSASNSVTPSATGGAATPRLVNISTRGQVGTGDNIMIGGFVVGGAETKRVVIRGRGPSLAAHGVPGTLADPAIRLFSGATPIQFNDDWQSETNAAEITASGQAPSDAKEAAILTTVSPNVPYTVHLTGVAETQGIAIVEVFELDKPEVPLLNISTRGPVLTGDQVMIGGFIIQGDAPLQVLVIAKGPSLGVAPFNVPGSLPDPTLELYQAGVAAPIDSNDNWVDSSNAAAIQASGNVPTSPLESAILRTLAPGAYTAIVRGKGAFQGIGLVEVYKK